MTYGKVKSTDIDILAFDDASFQPNHIYETIITNYYYSFEPASEDKMPFVIAFFNIKILSS